MKKYFVLLSFILFLFASCNSGYFTGVYEYEFINKSSETVQINVRNEGTYALKPAENLKLKFDHSNNYSLINNPRASLREECKEPHSYYYVYVENLSYVNMQFFNSSNFNVIVKEKNGLLGDKYGDTLTVGAGQIEKAKVFTYNPAFVSVFADSGLPADNVVSFGIIPN